MTIEFQFPETLHPSGDISVVDLAKILEGEYSIIEQFMESEFVNGQLRDKFFEAFVAQLETGSLRLEVFEEMIKDAWRQFGRSGKFGSPAYSLTDQSAAYVRAEKKARKTKIAFDPSDARPFLDTLTYMLSMQPKLILSNAENQMFGIELRNGKNAALRK